MLKKSLLGLGLVLMLTFSLAIPAFASSVSDGETAKVEGTIQSVDTVTGSFTVLAEDGATVTVFSPEGFDLTLLIVGDHVEAKGTVGTDGLFAATQIELQDGTEFEVEDEAEDADDDDTGEVEDDDDLDEDQDDLDDDDDMDDHSGDDHGSNSGSDHEDDDDDSSGSNSGSGSQSNDDSGDSDD